MEREFRALLADAVAEHPEAQPRLLVLTADAFPRKVPDNVVVQTASEWLLSR